MNADVWRSAQALFDRLLETEPEVRQELLARECGEDHELFEAVVRLLRADARTGALVDKIPRTAFGQGLDDELARRWIGRSVGAYKILEKIGQGGMGQVFLAEREDGTFDKRVAVKVISMATPAAHERFDRERRILAGLEHPAIARLLDGGATPDGLPYVVMELVEGMPLGGYCRVHRTGLEGRLKLFIDVCGAVEFAHQRLVVHRDIKPSNILVESTGQVRLLDFGIAKLIDDESEGEAPTELGERALTPEYASPEQLSGAPITTASDVYSLGVVLYELLAGVLPFASRTRPESPLKPPSAALRERLDLDPIGESTPPLAARRIRGDLDNIVLKALRAQPGERYGSVERLAADVRSYLAGLPVEAQAPSLGYRALKFVRRHALAVTLTAASTLLLMAFAVTTLLQAQRLERERDVSRQALDFLVGAFDSADPRVSMGVETTAREILARGVEQLELDREQPPSEVRAVLARTLSRVQSSLGAHEQARDLLREAVAIETALYGADAPRLGGVLSDLAEVLLLTVEYAEAEATAARAVELIPRDQPSLRIPALQAWAEAKAGLNDFDTSFELHARALSEARTRLPESDPLLVQSLLMMSLESGSRKQYTEALAFIDEAIGLQERHRPGDSELTTRLLGAAGGTALRIGDRNRAERDIRANLEMNRRIYGDQHSATATALSSLAAFESDAGRVERAAELYEESLTAFDESLGPDHPQTVGVRYAYARFLYQTLEDPARAEPVFRQAVASYETVEGSEDHANMGFLLASHAQALNDLERYAEAEPLWRRSWEIRVRRGVRKIKVALAVQLGLADALVGLERLAEAEKEYREAWDTMREEHGLDDPQTERAGESLAGLYRTIGQEAKAIGIEQALGGS